ncbi:MAG: hypothetical protein R2939_20615 [Kofleriaceae bacterium]
MSDAGEGGGAAAAPEPRCPKCGGEVRGEGCVRCGLGRAAMAGYRERADDGVAPELVAAWARVEAGWADDALHEDLVGAASSAQALAWAARKYRQAAAARPDDGRAASMQQRLALLAETKAMLTRAPSAPTRRYRGVVVIVVLGVVILTAGAMIARITAAPRQVPSPERPGQPALLPGAAQVGPMAPLPSPAAGSAAPPAPSPR